MDVFAIRDQLIRDYAAYIQSFIRISDPRLEQHVSHELAAGLLWPDPLLQLNPSFALGPRIDELTHNGMLHPLCRDIFCDKASDGSPKPLRLYQHQAEALQAAQTGDNYILTTGTGSGKSLAYIVPIVDYVLRHSSGGGIKAIIVYPMNALANSQLGELTKFLCKGFPEGHPPVTFRRYTGQENDVERAEIVANPPDILLTNYVMLELLLTRPYERPIVRAAQGLRFLVLDELHTYRGRQGADVSLLVRRVRDACSSPNVQCVGTSATLAEGGAFVTQQGRVAQMGSLLFGAPVKPERVIGETLRRATTEGDPQDPEFRAALGARLAEPLPQPSTDYGAFVRDPLSSWIESTFGLTTEAESGRLRRAIPRSITGDEGAAQALAELTLVPEERCTRAIQQQLLAGYQVLDPHTGFPVFAFRLHQFLNRGDTVYASLEEPEARYITTEGQQYVPGDRRRVILPLAFCRECGQEYYTVRRHRDEAKGSVAYLPRELTDQAEEEGDVSGFLFRNPTDPWPSDVAESIERLPEDWVETTGAVPRVKRDVRAKLPVGVLLDTGAHDDPAGLEYQFFPAPFPFCLRCGVAYDATQRSDIGKLTTLASGGRSTATTILSLAALRALRADPDLPRQAHKLLSFTDNRQDASLQAGHFNDFVEVGLLRAALYKAAQAAGPEGLRHDVLTLRVFEALALPLDLYATDPTVRFQARRETERALREVLGYRLYYDLRRGWRVTSPNLEQCGLLEIRYASLEELCASEDDWRPLHPALATATPEQRARIARILLDLLRRSLAIKVEYLNATDQERIQQLSSQKLVEPWSIDENERMVSAGIAYPRPRQGGDQRGNLFISARSGLGRTLRRASTFPAYGAHLNSADSDLIIVQLFATLRSAGLVEEVDEAQAPGDVPGYQLPAAAMIWRAGEGTQPTYDPLVVPRAPNIAAPSNAFFVSFYREVAGALQGIAAREHTAQVPGDERQKREALFREAKLPVLFCSPTMELGIDIALLNAVNMRNVPPTPANYAQRSGRAGRSGQPAIVFTYCTSGSPHDQYYARRPGLMVAGSVATPRLDLSNEDLVRAHAHAVWLAEIGLPLGSSLKEVLDLSGDPTLPLLPSVQAQIHSAVARERAAQRLVRILATLQLLLAQAAWFREDWLSKTLEQAATNLDRACDRWRGLYRAALRQHTLQNEIILDASRNFADKQQARRLRAEAESQMDLLTGGEGRRSVESDFYPYRYLASEGFLPGYSFPRLPLSAYIPARRAARGERDEFLSRPRFLAISEFGPRSIIYHEGSRYLVNKVILPVEDEAAPAEQGWQLATRAKLCPHCGYLHRLMGDAPGPDLCEHCGASLDVPLTALFRMQNVSTVRRQRINSDEEERLRMGYELITALRFSEHGDRPAYRTAQVCTPDGGDVLFKLIHGDAATLWRLNLGWRRRRDRDLRGFMLDIERGYWARNEQAEPEEDSAAQDPLSPRMRRVIPYVEDHRNCLLVEPHRPLALEVMASLQAALKSAIQVEFQLEDSELAAEPLPTADSRRVILLYESAEGGAGVLRHLLDDPQALSRVAHRALELCHYDVVTLDDLRHAPGRKEDCEAACYDCLMSYYNQGDHPLLDRALLRDLLHNLAHAEVQASPVAASRAEHLARLAALCESDLERRWLDFLEEHALRLPDVAQRAIESCRTRPDFLYTAQQVAIYVDGPPHDQPDVAADDVRITERLEDQGYTVVRFGYRDDWAAICAHHSYLFGQPASGSE